MTALQTRNRRVRQALRRIATERNDVLALAVLDQRPQREALPDPDRQIIVGWKSEYLSWAPGELVEAFGK